MLDTIVAFLKSQWVIDLGTILIIVLLFNSIIKRLLKRAGNYFANHHHLWKASFFRALYVPLSFYIWVFALFSVVYILDREFDKAHLLGYTVYQSMILIGILTVGWFLFRWKRFAIDTMNVKKSWEKVGLDPTRVDAIDKIITIVIFFIILAWLFEATGKGMGTILTIGGISAAAIGFAAKDLIANFFGGLLIYTNTPFKVGDYIKIPGKDVIGNVEEIGWYMTRVIDLEKLPVYIPNSMFSQFLVVNLSKRTHRRIHETIGLRYQDFSAVKKIVAEFQEILDTHPNLVDDFPKFAAFSAFGDSSLNLTVMAYSNEISGDSHRRITQELLFKLHDIVEKHQADFAYPSMTIYSEKPST